MDFMAAHVLRFLGTQVVKHYKCCADGPTRSRPLTTAAVTQRGRASHQPSRGTYQTEHHLPSQHSRPTLSCAAPMTVGSQRLSRLSMSRNSRSCSVTSRRRVLTSSMTCCRSAALTGWPGIGTLSWTPSETCGRGGDPR